VTDLIDFPANTPLEMNALSDHTSLLELKTGVDIGSVSLEEPETGVSDSTIVLLEGIVVGGNIVSCMDDEIVV